MKVEDQSKEPRRKGYRAPRWLLLVGVCVAMVLSAGWVTSSPSPAASATLQKVGVFAYNNLYDPAFLTDVQRDELARRRFAAITDAAAVIDSAASWQSADSAVLRLYDRAGYRGDAVAQQLIAVVMLRGALFHAAPSAARDDAILTHVRHLVANRGTDSASIHGALSVLAVGPHGRIADELRATVAAAARENDRVASVRTCAAPRAEMRLPRSAADQAGAPAGSHWPEVRSGMPASPDVGRGPGNR